MGISAVERFPLTPVLMKVFQLQRYRKKHAYGMGMSKGSLLPDHWHCHTEREDDSPVGSYRHI